MYILIEIIFKFIICLSYKLISSNMALPVLRGIIPSFIAWIMYCFNWFRNTSLLLPALYSPSKIWNLLLNCSLEQIKEFEYLPDFLDKLGFFSSYGVLIYLLGYEDKFKKEFEVSIWIDGVNYGSANGKSKKLAQQAVAKIAIEKLKEKIKKLESK